MSLTESSKATVESNSSQPSPRWAWLFAAGPIIWSVYFWVEGRAAAIGCTAATGPLILWAALGLAGSIMVTMAYNASRAGLPGRHARHSDPVVMRDGFLLGAGLLIASVLVGLPTVLTQPC